jgi:hypothetical protein
MWKAILNWWHARTTTVAAPPRQSHPEVTEARMRLQLLNEQLELMERE